MAQRKNDCITYLLHMDPLSGATEQNLSLGEGENNKKNEILLIFKNFYKSDAPVHYYNTYGN